MARTESDECDEKETEKLRDEVIKRMLNTPPKPRPKSKTGASGRIMLSELCPAIDISMEDVLA